MNKAIPLAERCAQDGVADWSGWHFHRCSRRGSVKEGGKLWCKQHAPSSVRARDEESARRYNKQLDAKLAPHKEASRLRAVNRDLLKALRKTRSILHGDLCQQFDSCVEACEDARDAIERAKEGK